MLPKRQKLIQAKSSSVEMNSNHNIASMFARQSSRSHVNSVRPDDQCMISQPANLSGRTDGPQLSNRLSLSLRRKRLDNSDTVISIPDDADNNNSVDISEQPCIVSQSTCQNPDATHSWQNVSSSEALLLSSESYSDTVSPISSNQQQGSDFIINQQEGLISDETSGETSAYNLLQAKQSADETEAVRVPYYLENFLLVLETVFNDTFYAELFNEDDLFALNAFKSLNGNCMKMEFNKPIIVFISYFMDLLCTGILVLLYMLLGIRLQLYSRNFLLWPLVRPFIS